MLDAAPQVKGWIKTGKNPQIIVDLKKLKKREKSVIMELLQSRFGYLIQRIERRGQLLICRVWKCPEHKLATSKNKVLAAANDQIEELRFDTTEDGHTVPS